METSSLLEPLVLSIPILAIGLSTLFAIAKPSKVNFLRIYIIAFVLHFALFPLYSFFSEWLTGYWSYTQTEIWAAYINLYFFLIPVIISLIIYDWVPKKYSSISSIPQLLETQYYSLSLKNIIIYFLVILGFLVSYNFAFGFTYYASGTLERNLSVPYFLVVLKNLFSIVLFGLIGYGAIHIIRGKKLRFIGVLLLCSNIFLDWYSRRNYILVFLVLILIKLLIDRFKIPLKQTVIVGSIGLLIVKVFFPFLFVFRQLTTEAAQSGRDATNLTETYQESQSKRASVLGKDEGKNVEYRTNQIARNIEFMRFPGPEENYMNGLLLATQVASVVPRALYPSKVKLGKVLAPEGIILLYYGRRNFDLSDNLPIYGFLEFGYWGAFIAGIFQSILLIVFERFTFIFNKLHPFLGLSVFMLIIYNHLNLEYGYVQELGMLRDLVILFIIGYSLKISMLILGVRVFRKKHIPTTITHP